jgi:hypothetical protein
MFLSIQIFVTKLFDKCIVLCLSYSIFFDKFIAVKKQRFNNFKQITFQGFLCDVFNVHGIPYDYRFIDIMGLNFLTINF